MARRCSDDLNFGTAVNIAAHYPGNRTKSGYARTTVANSVKKCAADTPAPGGGEFKIKSIGETGQNTEDETNVNRVFYSLIAHPSGTDLLNVSRRDISGREG